MALTSIRARVLAHLGSKVQILQEVFRVVETRGHWQHLQLLLGGRDPSCWSRTWSDSHVEDPRLQWQSPEHGAPDFRTPLMCVFLATPRYPLLARLTKKTRDLQALACQQPTSLAGLSGAHALSADKDACLGQVARNALEEWRTLMVDAILNVGARNLVEQTDFAKRTALHYAAAAGDISGVASLLRAGADASATDRWGRTPGHIAASHGHQCLVQQLVDACGHCQPTPADRQDSFGHSIKEVSGFCLRSRDTIEERSSLSLQELFCDFVSLNRPVIVRGGVSQLPAMKRWANRKELHATLGDAPLASGVVPYSPGSVSVTLQEFISSAEQEAGYIPQPYVFDVSVASRRPQMLDDAELLTPEAKACHVAYLRQPQFGLGFQGAGAPVHTHYAAFNGLFVGSKRWFLLPPQAAFWSFSPSASWEQSTQCAALRSQGLLLELTQHAGDLLFVPEGWGHATLLQEYCVGVGQEFIPWSSLSS